MRLLSPTLLLLAACSTPAKPASGPSSVAVPPESALAPPPATALARGNKELAAGRPGQALKLFREASARAARRGQTPPPELSLLEAVALLRGPDPAAGERRLREQLATGSLPAAAARELAAVMVRNERLEDAVAVLEAALKRRPGRADLLLFHARVISDLGQFEKALAELRPLAASPAAAGPVRLEVVRIERALGRLGPALSDLRALIAEKNPWVHRHEDELSKMAQQIDAERVGGHRTYSVRELLALLRGAPQASLRQRVLRTLAARDRGVLLERALRIAWRDAEPTIRVEALRLAVPLFHSRRPKMSRSWIHAGLRDPAPAVRGTAARLTETLPPTEAHTLLLRVLAGESDGYAFRQMHEALRAITGADVHLPPDGEEDPATRQRLARRWQELPWRR